MTFGHPSPRRLRSWAETGFPTGVRDHVETCRRCTARLDSFSDVRYDLDPRPSLGLTDLLRPPAADGPADGGGARDDLLLVASLFSVAVDTAHLMLSPETVGAIDSTPTSGSVMPAGPEEELAS